MGTEGEMVEANLHLLVSVTYILQYIVCATHAMLAQLRYTNGSYSG